MPTAFNHFPTRPRHEAAENAYFILRNAHDAASSFFKTFAAVRRARQARGTATDEEQDLLRAMLLFSTAGLDSMVKQLINDTLGDVIDGQDGATAMFKQFIERRLHKDEQLDRRFVADILGDVEPRKRLIAVLVDDLTSKSLQSTEQLLRAAAHFNIPSNAICTDTNILNNIFKIRNQIAHEMDIDFSQPNRSRRPRACQRMKELADEVFRVASNFLAEVDRRLA